ncbi:MAG: ATP-binding cassette domain-containing protein [Caldilineaceae bacterium]|nr:ATP-binding cassette domain-containing protein [Caldilineaceae bacterium]
MIEVRDLIKAYGPLQALKGVSFDVADGEIVGLLGPNGAGKTTIIKILTGYLQPDEGTVEVDGLDVLSQTQAAQARIGYLPENAPLYPELSVQAYLKLMADLRQLPVGERRARLSEAVYATGLADRLTQPIGQLSKGYRQRVGLAQAILHRPRLLILDEPTVGLDPTQIVEIRGLIRRLSEHSTILFSTHILTEVEALCDRAIILMNGEIRADARLNELASSTDAILVLDKAADNAAGALKGLAGVKQVEQQAGANGQVSYRVSGQENADLCPAIYRLATQHQWPLRELRSDRQTLESVFSKLAAG